MVGADTDVPTALQAKLSKAYPSLQGVSVQQAQDIEKYRKTGQAYAAIFGVLVGGVLVMTWFHDPF